MTATTTLPRYTREYVNLSDLLDALSLTDEERDTFESALGNWYTWGDTAYTLASAEGVAYWMRHTLPAHLPATLALLDGVAYVNLEG